MGIREIKTSLLERYIRVKGVEDLCHVLSTAASGIVPDFHHAGEALLKLLQPGARFHGQKLLVGNMDTAHLQALLMALRLVHDMDEAGTSFEHRIRYERDGEVREMTVGDQLRAATGRPGTSFRIQYDLPDIHLSLREKLEGMGVYEELADALRGSRPMSGLLGVWDLRAIDDAREDLMLSVFSRSGAVDGDIYAKEAALAKHLDRQRGLMGLAALLCLNTEGGRFEVDFKPVAEKLGQFGVEDVSGAEIASFVHRGEIYSRRGVQDGREFWIHIMAHRSLGYSRFEYKDGSLEKPRNVWTVEGAALCGPVAEDAIERDEAQIGIFIESSGLLLTTEDFSDVITRDRLDLVRMFDPSLRDFLTSHMKRIVTGQRIFLKNNYEKS